MKIDYDEVKLVVQARVDKLLRLTYQINIKVQLKLVRESLDELESITNTWGED